MAACHVFGMIVAADLISTAMAGLSLGGSSTTRSEEPPPVMGLWRSKWINPDEANDYFRINPGLTGVLLKVGEEGRRPVIL